VAGRNIPATKDPSHMLKRVSIFFYGVACYAIFLATFVYLVGFVGNFAVPRSIDSPAIAPFGESLAIDLLLIGLFAIQHSVMARPGFKRRMMEIIPEAAERSTYVLCSSAALIVLFAGWHPLGSLVWEMRSPFTVGVLHLFCGFGWAMVLVSTFLINHFDLFGLRQVYLNLIDEMYWPVDFDTPGLYRFVRHPLYLGFILAMWATPVMTAAHLVFAVMMTLYILAGIQLEENDLVRSIGTAYREYRKRVPMLIPFLK
jgi:protein-S-isoprenylcysteine O-methyltransferase Ste14